MYIFIHFFLTKTALQKTNRNKTSSYRTTPHPIASYRVTSRHKADSTSHHSTGLTQIIERDIWYQTVSRYIIQQHTSTQCNTKKQRNITFYHITLFSIPASLQFLQYFSPLTNCFTLQKFFYIKHIYVVRSFSPFYYAGTCFDRVGDYYCHCEDGYTGRDCGSNIDECQSSPCLNGNIIILAGLRFNILGVKHHRAVKIQTLSGVR